MGLNNESFKILIVDDEKQHRDVLKIILDGKGYITETAVNGMDALEKLKNNNFHLVLSDLIMGGMDGVELLGKIKKQYDDVEVIIITGYGTIENAVEAMKKGAFTYFVKGHDPEELIKEVKKVQKSFNHNEKIGHQENNSEFMLSTNSEKFKRVLAIAEKAGKSDVNILILGESGVGKEVFARHIHHCSERKNTSFVPINCQAFSEGLLESELFGHEKGAFTGATEQRKGRFESAHKGTLFLDELGEISLSTQIKLLRILETRSIERMGSNQSIEVDFRLICATNKDLQKEIINKTFREDFFYRISTITIEIPPLRERKEDLPILVDFFLEKSKVKFKKEIIDMEKGIMPFLLSYDYPGNIRELKNIIERLVVLSEDGVILERCLPEGRATYFEEMDLGDLKTLKDMRREIEAEYIEKVLEICEYNMTEAAKKLDISRRQLFNKMKEYGLK